MIYLVTGSGEPNYGDDLITYLWVSYYRSIGYEGEIIIDCKSIEGSLNLHRDLDDNVFFIKNIKKIAHGREGDVEYYLEKGREFALRSFSKSEGFNSKKQSKFFDFYNNKPRFIHLLGGGYINGSWPNSFSTLGAMDVISKVRKIPCFATGLGMEPLSKLNKKEKETVSEIINSSFVFFEVRDSESFNSISSFSGYLPNLIDGNDDVFLLNIEDLSFKEKEGNSIHISGFEIAFDNFDFLGFIEKIKSEREFSNIFFWGCNKGDRSLYKKLVDFIPNLSYIYNRNLIYKKVMIGKGDFMITSRYHPHLIGFRSGSDGIYVAGSDFYKNKHKLVKELGSSYVVYDSFLSLDSYSSYSKHAFYDDVSYVKKKRVLANYICNYI